MPVNPAPADEVSRLRGKLEETQAAFVSAVIEKNFLQRAMADLNFHHNAHDGIVFTDKQNRIVYANPYFLQMMQIETPSEILNQPFPAYMWDKPEDEIQLFQDVHKDGFVRERALSLYNQKKQPVFVACSSVASKDDDGNFVGTEIMLCNVTTKHRIQTELVEQTESLQKVTARHRLALAELTILVEGGATSEELLLALKQMQADSDHLDQAEHSHTH